MAYSEAKLKSSGDNSRRYLLKFKREQTFKDGYSLSQLYKLIFDPKLFIATSSFHYLPFIILTPPGFSPSFIFHFIPSILSSAFFCLFFEGSAPQNSASRYEGESVNRSQVDRKRKTCDIITSKKTFVSLHILHQRCTLVPSIYQCVGTRNIEVFDCWLSHFRTSV
jgi:hypothetical protein